MIWFGRLPQPLLPSVSSPDAAGDEHVRMQDALRLVASCAPHLTGDALLDALAATGRVDRAAAARLLPWFRDFDADAHFAEHLRCLSLKGAQGSEEFRVGVRRVVEDVVGNAHLEGVGAEEGIRFRSGDGEGVVLAYPETGFSLGGEARRSVAAVVEDAPDALVLVARNFQPGTAEQLGRTLKNTGIAGTLVTVNLLLGIRAVVLRYQPPLDRVVATLAAGRALRSVDVARLGDRG